MRLDERGMAGNASAGRNAAHFNVAEQDTFMRRIVALRVFGAVHRRVLNLALLPYG